MSPFRTFRETAATKVRELPAPPCTPTRLYGNIKSMLAVEQVHKVSVGVTDGCADPQAWSSDLRSRGGVRSRRVANHFRGGGLDGCSNCGRDRLGGMEAFWSGLEILDGSWAVERVVGLRVHCRLPAPGRSSHFVSGGGSDRHRLVPLVQHCHDCLAVFRSGDCFGVTSTWFEGRKDSLNAGSRLPNPSKSALVAVVSM